MEPESSTDFATCTAAVPYLCPERVIAKLAVASLKETALRAEDNCYSLEVRAPFRTAVDERFPRDDMENPRQATHAYLAGLVGCSRPTASRLYNGKHIRGIPYQKLDQYLRMVGSSLSAVSPTPEKLLDATMKATLTMIRRARAASKEPISPADVAVSEDETHRIAAMVKDIAFPDWQCLCNPNQWQAWLDHLASHFQCQSTAQPSLDHWLRVSLVSVGDWLAVRAYLPCFAHEFRYYSHRLECRLAAEPANELLKTQVSCLAEGMKDVVKLLKSFRESVKRNKATVKWVAAHMQLPIDELTALLNRLGLGPHDFWDQPTEAGVLFMKSRPLSQILQELFVSNVGQVRTFI
jgi:hypothetical protein